MCRGDGFVLNDHLYNLKSEKLGQNSFHICNPLNNVTGLHNVFVKFNEKKWRLNIFGLMELEAKNCESINRL